MRTNTKNYSGKDSRNYSRAKEYDQVPSRFFGLKYFGGFAIGVAAGSLAERAFLPKGSFETYPELCALGIVSASIAGGSAVGIYREHRYIKRHKKKRE